MCAEDVLCPNKAQSGSQKEMHVRVWHVQTFITCAISVMCRTLVPLNFFDDGHFRRAGTAVCAAATCSSWSPQDRILNLYQRWSRPAISSFLGNDVAILHERTPFKATTYAPNTGGRTHV